MDLSATAKTILPWISAALTGGPVGIAAMAVSKIAGAIGLDSDATLPSVVTKLNVMNAAEVANLAKIENDFKLAVQNLGYKTITQLAQFDIDAIKIVNDTIQTELANSANEAWYQKAWRPACGFSLAIGSFVGVFFTCILFYKAIIENNIDALNAIPQLATSLALILGVPGAAVGIAAWHRGVEKIEDIKASLSTSIKDSK